MYTRSARVVQCADMLQQWAEPQDGPHRADVCWRLAVEVNRFVPVARKGRLAVPRHVGAEALVATERGARAHRNRLLVILLQTCAVSGECWRITSLVQLGWLVCKKPRFC
jgi:hypothetical protein